MFSFSSKKLPQIDADEVNKASQDNTIAILDVRTTQEYSKGKIKNSINLPVDQIPQKIESFLPDKNQKIYVYCLSGARSEAAVSAMTSMGYKNVFNMTHGLLAWRIKGYQLI